MSTIDRRGATVSAADPPIGTNPNPDLAIKAPVRAATTGSGIALSGLQTVDGVALAAGDRVLVKDQTDATTNGLYNAATGPWTRTIDANNSSQFTTGTQVLVAAGTSNANGAFKLTTANPVVVGTSALTWALGVPPATVSGLTITPAALSTNLGLTVTQNGAGTVGPGFSYNSIAITDNLASGGNVVDGLSVFLGLAGSAVNGARQAFQSTVWLTQPTSPTNPSRFYVGAVAVARAVSGDGGGVGTEKGSIFAGGDIAQLAASATHMAECCGREINTGCESGSSVLDKWGLSIVQLANDAVSGSRNDAAVRLVNQGGAIGWGTLIQIGDGLNASPLTTSGSIVAIKGSPTFANGIDLSGASITGYAFRTPGGKINVASAAGTPNANFPFAVQLPDATFPNPGQYLFAGGSKAVRLWTNAAGAFIEGIDATGVASYQPLTIGAGVLTFQTLGANAGQFAASGGFSVGTTSDPGAGAIYVNTPTFMLRTKTSFTNGAAAQTATLTNAPAAGNPTKWIAIDDNGTTRQIPAW